MNRVLCLVFLLEVKMQIIKIEDDDIELTGPMLLRLYEKAPKEGGLYFLYSFKFNLLYIGKTANLRYRLASYCNTGSHLDDVIHNVLMFQYMLIDDPAERDMLETYYINAHKPPFNRDKTYTYKTSRFDKLYRGGDECEFDVAYLKKAFGDEADKIQASRYRAFEYEPEEEAI
jgi:hypothetical protein